MKRATDEVRVGQLIREARLSCGLSQRRLAELVGVSPSYLCRLELGRRSVDPQVSTLLAFMRVLGQSLSIRLVQTWGHDLHGLDPRP